MRLIDADELKKEFMRRIPMGAAALIKIIDEARTIAVIDEAPALIDCNYEDIEED